jgi:serine/threonine protein kinase
LNLEAPYFPESKPMDGFPKASAQPIFRNVLLAVSQLHQRNIVHRDIKLMNLIVLESGAVKLTDFGLDEVVNGGEKPHEATVDVHLTGEFPFGGDLGSTGFWKKKKTRWRFNFVYRRNFFCEFRNGM